MSSSPYASLNKKGPSQRHKGHEIVWCLGKQVLFTYCKEVLRWVLCQCNHRPCSLACPHSEACICPLSISFASLITSLGKRRGGQPHALRMPAFPCPSLPEEESSSSKRLSKNWKKRRSYSCTDTCDKVWPISTHRFPSTSTWSPHRTEKKKGKTKMTCR